MKQNVIRAIKDYAFILVGTLITAIGLDVYLIPNRIAAGGISGVSTILYHLLGIPAGGSMFVMNLALFVVAFFFLGRSFGLRSIISSVALAFFIDFFRYVVVIPVFTGNLLLSTLFGDILTGIGMGLIFYKNASTGGTDILAKIVNKYTRVSVGKCLLLIDALVTIGAGFAFGAEMAMFALLAIYINTRTIDVIMDGIYDTRQLIIISDKQEEISRCILNKVGRGVTRLLGQGAYTCEKRYVLLTYIKRTEVNRVLYYIRRIDPQAFVTIVRATDVMGKGFKYICHA